MKNLRTRSLAGSIAALSAVTIALVGCSSGGAAVEADPSTPTALVVSRGSVNIESIILAEEQGFFEDEGIDVGEMQVGMGGSVQISGVISGEYDVAFTDAVTAVRAISEGMPIVVIAGTASADPDYEGEVGDGLIVPPGSPVTAWKDLAGKKIGVPQLGGLPHLSTVIALQENGVDIDSVEFVPLPVDALTGAAANGQVDAVSIFGIFLLSAVDEGFTRIGNGQREYLPNTPQSLWITSKQTAQENPEALKRFVSALTKGTEFGNANPDAVRQVYHDHTQLPAPFIDNRMVNEPLSTGFNKDGWSGLLKALKDAGEIRDDLTFEDIVWEGVR